MKSAARNLTKTLNPFIPASLFLQGRGSDHYRNPDTVTGYYDMTVQTVSYCYKKVNDAYHLTSYYLLVVIFTVIMTTRSNA